MFSKWPVITVCLFCVYFCMSQAEDNIQEKKNLAEPCLLKESRVKKRYMWKDGTVPHSPTHSFFEWISAIFLSL